MSFRPALLVAFLALACTGSPGPGDGISLDGLLISAVTGTTLQQGSFPTLTVDGRSADEFKIDFKSVSQIPDTLQFKAHSLPNGEALIFEVTGGGLDTSATLPITIDSHYPPQIGVLPGGTTDFLIRCATGAAPNCPGVMATQTINLQTQAIILGTIQPKVSGCSVRRVDLLDPNTGGTVLQPTVNGPFYFDASGVIQGAGGFFPSVECDYIIFNVLPGRYLLHFDSDLAIPDVSVVALGGRVMVGYNVPRL